MSPEAERLLDALNLELDAVFDDGSEWHESDMSDSQVASYVNRRMVARTITELGITEEMVEGVNRVADMLDFMASEEFVKVYPSTRERIHDVERESSEIRTVATALSTLLEVAANG